MLARIVLWVIFAVCAAMTVAFLSGHGANLIAGYNTATEAEKETVNERKLLQILAWEAKIDADIVMPFPDSGNYAALGYAQASGIPLEFATQIGRASCRERV